MKMVLSCAKGFIYRIGNDVFRISSPFSRLICTQANSDYVQVVDNLISIFTKPSFNPESWEIKHLRLNLSTQIVETVLKEFKNWKRALEFFKWSSAQPGYAHNCYTFNAMASILSSARQNASLSALSTDMLNSRCYMTPGALGQFLKCLGGRGLIREANVLFDEVKRWNLCALNSYVYSCLLWVISKSSDVELLELRLNEMQSFGWEIDKFSLTPVLQCYCNAGKFEQALTLFNEMLDKGMVDVYVLSLLAVSISKMGKVGKAFELVERMEDFNVSLNEKTFYVLIHGFAREGQVNSALQLYNKMQKQGIIPDISIFDALIGGLCTKGEVAKALDLFSQMKDLGIRPDVKILCQLLPFVSERQMNQLIKESPPNLNKESSLLLYNSVLKCLTVNGSVEKGYNLLRAMMGDEDSFDFVKDLLLSQEILVKPDTTSFEIVTDGFCRTHNFDVALQLLQDMDCVSCQRSVLLYNNIIDSLSNGDKLDECYKLMNEMKESGLQPTHFTHNSIFRCLCRRVDVPGAMRFFKDMCANGYEPWIKNYTLLVEKLCEQGRPAEARDFLDEMTQEGFLPNIVAYSAAIDGFVKVKELDHALQLFRDLCQRGYCPDVVAYNTVINGLCKTERLSEAHDLLNEMLVKGLVPSVVTYNLLIDAWCKEGNVDQVYLWLSKMAEGGAEPSVVTYTTVINGLCSSSRPKDAVNLFQEMEKKGCSPNRVTFMALIYGLCKCDMAYDAQLYLSMMEERKMLPDAYIYVALLDTFISNASLSEAFDVLEKMASHSIFPDFTDKNHLVLRKAICVLHGDPKFSSSVENLTKAGRLPSHVIGSEVD